MIVRIVKMQLKQENIDDFIAFSSDIKSVIRNQKGCLFLDILQDVKDIETFFTYSHWKTEDDLNEYRKSDFFMNVWPKAKKWFSGKPEVWTLIQTETVKSNE